MWIQSTDTDFFNLADVRRIEVKQHWVKLYYNDGSSYEPVYVSEDQSDYEFVERGLQDALSAGDRLYLLQGRN